MYCPTCLNNTLKVQSKGVIKLEINKKHRDANVLLYNLSGDGQEQLRKDMIKKINEFIAWYSNFNHKDPIKQIHLYSNNFECSRGCAIDINSKMTIVDVLVAKSEVKKMIIDLCNKYNLMMDPEFEII